MGGGGKSKKVTVGYHYYMNLHFAVAHAGVDELLEIRVGGRSAWKGNLSGPGSALVSQVNLFGGEKREGGLMGVVDFMPGEATQPINPSLQSAIQRATGSTNVPAYRGVSSLFFKGFDGANMTGTPWENANPGTLPPDINGIANTQNVAGFLGNALKQIVSAVRMGSSFYWSAMNPYFKNPQFLLRRAWTGWYSSRARIGEDMNPIHIIYECLTNKDWGLGYPTQDIDDASFRAAADVCYNEGFGISLKWTEQVRIQEFIDLIDEHINANLVEDRETGLWRVIMVRDNYDPTALFELNESNCILEDFQRKTLGETINEVTVSYTRIEDGETDTVTVQDLANFANTGRINAQKREYPGIVDRDLAYKVALRDLNTLSKPVAKVTILCNRSILGKYPGDVVKLNWPRLGLNGVVIRIGRMDLGDVANGRIRLEGIEDVFALPQSAYATPQPIGWVDTNRSPEPVVNQRLYELSYYELYTSTESADRLDWPEDVGFVAVSPLAPNVDASTLALHDNATGSIISEGEFTPRLTLTQDCGYLDQTLFADISGVDATQLLEGGLAWLDNELIEMTSVDIAAGSITVNRAMVDTVPARHTAGAYIWLYQQNTNVLDPTTRVNGEIASYKLLTQTSNGELRVANAPTVNYTLQNRQLRPYRPGNVQVNNQGLSSVIAATAPLSLTWAHRDRTQEVTPDATLFGAGNIGPEVGVTYTVVVVNEDGVTERTEAGLTGTLYDYVDEEVDLAKDELPYSGLVTFVPGAGVVVITSGYLVIGGAASGGNYSGELDVTNTSHPDWVANFEQTENIGFLRYVSSAASTVEVPAETQTINLFDVYWQLQIAGANGTVSDDTHTMEIEFLDDQDNVIAAIRSQKDGTYRSGLWYGSSLTSLTKTGQSGNYPSTKGVLSFTNTSMNFVNTRTSNFNNNFTFNANFSIVTKMRVKTYAKSTFSDGGYAGAHIKVLDGYRVTPVQPSPRKNTQLGFKLKAVRDGLDSFQQHDITVERAGYGYNYGNYYGGPA